MRHTVEHAGWRFAHVDGLHAETKAEFLRAAGEALDFPDYYGQNFDALADCLDDVSGGEGSVLLWDGWGPLARADQQAFSVALSVLGTRVNAERGGRFAVLLRGEGPAVPGVAEPRLIRAPATPSGRTRTAGRRRCGRRTAGRCPAAPNRRSGRSRRARRRPRQ